MKKQLAVGVLVSSLVACSGGGGSDASAGAPILDSVKAPEVLLAELETTGALPTLDRSTTIEGLDADANGVRDDVDGFIVANYSTPPQRAAAVQFAATLQSAMIVETSDPSAVKAVSVRGTRAVNCVYAQFDGAEGDKQPGVVVQELRSVSTNTKARLLAYLAYSKALDGTSGALPEGDTCE